MRRVVKDQKLILKTARSEDGFTLLELLIATAIFVVIIVAVFDLYLNHQKHAYVQEEITDVQQSLRLGTESIISDIRMAGMTGMTVLSASDPIETISDNSGLNASDTISLNSVSSSKNTAMVAMEVSQGFIAGSVVTFTVRTAADAANFKAGDIARVLNPVKVDDLLNPYFTLTDGYFTVVSVNTAVPSITLRANSSSAGSKFIPAGSIIAKTSETAPDTFPNVVKYCIGPAAGCAPDITTCPASDCLIRMVNGTATEVDIAATNITDLQFAYLVDGSPGESDQLGALQDIRAVRVTITGENTATKDYFPTTKIRTLTTIVKLRNR